MTLIGKDGKEYDVTYAFAPTLSGKCIIELADSRKISVIAEEFEDVANFHVIEPNVGEHDYSGYTEIVSIIRKDANVNIQLIRPSETL